MRGSDAYGSLGVLNPRRACTARVTVIGSVFLSVRLKWLDPKAYTPVMVTLVIFCSWLLPPVTGNTPSVTG